MPLKATMCGLPGASSTIVKSPVRKPVAVGVKVMLILHVAPAASVVPHVVVCAKSSLAVILLIVNEPVPVLLSTTVRGAVLLPVI